MDTELQRLQKEINGKLVRLETVIEGCLSINAILIWPPDGPLVSVKPYGETPEAIISALEMAGLEGWDIEKVSKPEFCFASHPTDAPNLDVLRGIASIEEGGIYDYNNLPVPESHKALREFHDNPSCPYG